MDTPDAKKARLAEALRANLRRRKAQAREVGVSTQTGPKLVEDRESKNPSS